MWHIEADRRRPVGSRPPDQPLPSNAFERDYYGVDRDDRVAADAATADDNWSRPESRGGTRRSLMKSIDAFAHVCL